MEDNLSLQYGSDDVQGDNQDDIQGDNQDDIQEENINLLHELTYANEEGNLEKYIELFHQYIDNPNIKYSIVYTDIVGMSAKRILYPYCLCCDNPDDIDMEFYNRRYYYCLPCNCPGGKRYLALKDAYSIELNRKYKKYKMYSEVKYDEAKYNEVKCSTFYLTIQELFKHFDCDFDTFEKSDIIKFIESTGPVDLHYQQYIRIRK